MKKSIIAVALALVAMATLMTACKKNEDFKEKPIPIIRLSIRRTKTEICLLQMLTAKKYP